MIEGYLRSGLVLRLFSAAMTGYAVLCACLIIPLKRQFSAISDRSGLQRNYFRDFEAAGTPR